MRLHQSFCDDYFIKKKNLPVTCLKKGNNEMKAHFLTCREFLDWRTWRDKWKLKKKDVELVKFPMKNQRRLWYLCCGSGIIFSNTVSGLLLNPRSTKTIPVRVCLINCMYKLYCALLICRLVENRFACEWIDILEKSIYWLFPEFCWNWTPLVSPFEQIQPKCSPEDQHIFMWLFK